MTLILTSPTNGNTHIANENRETLCGSKGNWYKSQAQNIEIVTCNKCRKLAGLNAPTESYKSRTARGLDSSAWGANKGR